MPDLTEAAVLYAQLMTSDIGARILAEAYEQLRIRAAELNADDQSLDAARLRGMVFSHRDWIQADPRREMHRHTWRQFFAEFDAVVCPITALGAPARSPVTYDGAPVLAFSLPSTGVSGRTEGRGGAMKVCDEMSER